MTHRPATFAIPGDIASLTGGYIYERRLLEGLRDLGHPMRHLALPAGFPTPSGAEMARAAALLAAVDPAHPLILDGLVFGAIAPTALAQVRAPLIAMIHHPLALETGLSAARRDHLYRTERANLGHARHVMVPSLHTKAILTGQYGVAPGMISVVPPGTDRPPHAAAPERPPLILSVGILHPRKGHDVLISALGELAGLDWRAVIVGNPWDADCAKALTRQIAGSPAGERIRLAGRVPQAELETLYAKASIFALATRYEGYGIVLDEALSCGLPIVSCRVGAVPQTVPAAAGILVPADRPLAFAEALRALLTNEFLRQEMAAQAFAAGRNLPGWDDTARIASAVIDRLD
ncbi:glycosyltransferase family 4 protein [Paracoccus ravus]|uniref:glycosyltransferase family 4 protein n=1 Tax=Paracoccus ravus TaxID=2447760 RepID=UPI00106E367F|nr:glycosyltransferase family 4 protein [Paracoccus ravus]